MQPRRLVLFLWLIFSAPLAVQSFLPFVQSPSHITLSTPNSNHNHYHKPWRLSSQRPNKPQLFAGKDWERELEKAQEVEAQKSSPGGTVAGAVLGGLLLGPFGAVFGATLGSSLGRSKAKDRAREEEMKRLGLSQDMLDAARDVGLALERNMEGLEAVRESYSTQKRLAKRLDDDARDAYDKAKDCLSSGDEEGARKYLSDREMINNKLKDVLKTCATAKQQLDTMESNAAVLERRAMEIDALLRRTVGAKAVQDSTVSSLLSSDASTLSLERSDPLLDKFRDMGID